MSNPQVPGKAIGVVVLLVFGFIFLSIFAPFTTIPAGHVGVATLFGKVDTNELPAGFHIINPLKKVFKIDCRNHEETFSDLGVPSQDQLSTEVDITVKWRVIPPSKTEETRKGFCAYYRHVH